MLTANIMHLYLLYDYKDIPRTTKYSENCSIEHNFLLIYFTQLTRYKEIQIDKSCTLKCMHRSKLGRDKRGAIVPSDIFLGEWGEG